MVTRDPAWCEECPDPPRPWQPREPSGWVMEVSIRERVETGWPASFGSVAQVPVEEGACG